MQKRPDNRTTIVYIGLLVFVFASYAGYSLALKGTDANMLDVEKISGNSFAVPAFEVDPGWQLNLGNSKATWPYPGQPPRIAQYENGKLVLDFGDIKAGNSNNSNDVFRIKNNRSMPLSVSLSLNPEIAGYFSLLGLSGGNILEPGQEKSVEMKLDTAPTTPIGMYEGVLSITCGEGYTPVVIPVRLEVLFP